LLLLTRGIVDGTPASLRMQRQIYYQDHAELLLIAPVLYDK
jgi:hypothetical protein